MSSYISISVESRSVMASESGRGAVDGWWFLVQTLKENGSEGMLTFGAVGSWRDPIAVTWANCALDTVKLFQCESK